MHRLAEFIPWNEFLGSIYLKILALDILVATFLLQNSCLFFLQGHYFPFIQSFSPPVPEIIDLVFAKTSPKRSFSMTEYERFGLIVTKSGSVNSSTGHLVGTFPVENFLSLFLPGHFCCYISCCEVPVSVPARTFC